VLACELSGGVTERAVLKRCFEYFKTALEGSKPL